jgi:hypothetical protein
MRKAKKEKKNTTYLINITKSITQYIQKIQPILIVLSWNIYFIYAFFLKNINSIKIRVYSSKWVKQCHYNSLVF